MRSGPSSVIGIGHAKRRERKIAYGIAIPFKVQLCLNIFQQEIFMKTSLQKENKLLKTSLVAPDNNECGYLLE